MNSWLLLQHRLEKELKKLFIWHITLLFISNFLQSRFYKTILNLKTRLQKQNLKKILIFFHDHLNLFICSKNLFKTKLKVKSIFYRMIFFFTEWNFFSRKNFFLQNESFYTEWFFLQNEIFLQNYFFFTERIFFAEWNFFKGNLFDNFIWKKKFFPEKQYSFC